MCGAIRHDGVMSDASLADAFHALRSIEGPEHVLTDDDVRASFETDWTRRYHGNSLAVVRPSSTESVRAVVQVCRDHGLSLVPQGGNTGLVGGGIPHDERSIVLSTARMRHLGPVDEASASIVVGAGAPLAAVQRAARSHGLELGVDLASRESATIGGMVATNAGGLHFVRYGPMRQQIEGLVAVLGDATVVGRVPGLAKDNTGISWPALMAGSEGTLGIVTEVHLRLVTQLDEHVTALVGLESVDDAVRLCARVRRDVDSVMALEFVTADGVELVQRQRGIGAPFPGHRPALVLLIDCAGPRGSSERIAADLAAGLSDRTLVAVAIEPEPRRRLWEYREAVTESIAKVGIPHKLDVSLPASELAAFVARVPEVIAAADPGAYPVLFGHLGDGNVHVNVLGAAPDDTRADDAVLQLVVASGGSISAEHGIGVAKARYLPWVRRPEELAAFRRVRRALDPDGILNPWVWNEPGDPRTTGSAG